MEDKMIVDLFFDRHEDALVHCQEKYGKLAFRIAHNLIDNESDAEEIVNDTFLGVWNAIPPKRPDSLKAFVCKVARNLALKKLEFCGAKKRRAQAEISLHELAEILPDPNAIKASDEQLGTLISDFLRTENETARNVFLRKYWFFDSVADIATRFGCSESKIKSLLFHTRKRLKKYLIEREVFV